MFHGYVHPDFNSVAQRFAQQLPQGRAGGGALTVYHHGKLVLDIHGGTRDRAGTPWTADTLALSYSTTKGVAATLLHCLADRGLIDYDQRVAHYWPAFAQQGKGQITVRQLLCHEAGLYHLRELIADAEEMNDWGHMLAVMEAARPAHRPGAGNAYHALTFGWLLGGLMEKITSKPFAQLLEEEISHPLQLDGCYIGLPDSELARRALLIKPEPKPRPAASNSAPRPARRTPLKQKLIEGALALTGFDSDSAIAAFNPKGISHFDFNAQSTVQACIPGAGGLFTSRSLAMIYAMLANGGQWNGRRLLSPRTLAALQTVQNRRRGQVMPLPMHWRLGYHRVFTTGPRTPQAFGHFGYGGSGAWCDPSRALAVGFTTNTGAGSPFGDWRLWQLNSAIIHSAEKRGA